MKTPKTIIQEIYNIEIQRYSKNEIPSILVQLKNNELTRDQLVKLISVRYEVANFFEDLLRVIIKKIEEDESLSTVAKQKLLYSAEQNLKEELGEEEKYGGAHEDGRRVLLTALGVDYLKWKSSLGTFEHVTAPSLASRKLIESLKGIIEEGSVEAVALLWYYENRISLGGVCGDYYILLKAFENKFPEFKKETYVEGDVLWHIASHAHHDEFHAKIAKEGLESLEGFSGSTERTEETCIETRAALDAFWDMCLRTKDL